MAVRFADSKEEVKVDAKPAAVPGSAPGSPRVSQSRQDIAAVAAGAAAAGTTPAGPGPVTITLSPRRSISKQDITVLPSLVSRGGGGPGAVDTPSSRGGGGGADVAATATTGIPATSRQTLLSPRLELMLNASFRTKSRNVEGARGARARHCDVR